MPFLASPAYLTIYGGGAGGGKSWALLYAMLRWVQLRGFVGLIFRKYLVDIKQAGGLWSEAEQLYPLLGGVPNRHDWEWKFPSGAVIKFGAIDADYKTRYHGAQAAVIAFDEITDFDEEEVFFFQSRLRSKLTATHGFRTRILGTCNPDADSWLARFLSWWWDPETGYAVQERAGKVRCFARLDEEVVWADSKAELLALRPDVNPKQVKTATFCPASLKDNVYLDADGEYEGGLLGMDKVQRERLLLGNWLIRYRKGEVFEREWFAGKIVSRAPDGVRWWRIWDLASTAEARAQNHSYTAGLKIGELDGRIYLADLVHGRWDAGDVEHLVVATAAGYDAAKMPDWLAGAGTGDGRDVAIWICKERGSAGARELSGLQRRLVGYTIGGDIETGDKIERLAPAAAAAKNGNMYLVAGEWNERLLSLLERLPAKVALDVGDALSAGVEQVSVAAGKPTMADAAAALDHAVAALQRAGEGAGVDALIDRGQFQGQGPLF